MTSENGRTMKEPSREKVTRVILEVTRTYRLDPRWHSVGRLMDALASASHDDVLAWVAQRMAASERLTRSSFVGSFLEFVGESEIRAKVHEAFQLQKRRDHERIGRRVQAGGARGRAARPPRRR